MFKLFGTKERLTTLQKVRSLLTALLFMATGVVIFKYIPMEIWGSDIRFDASLHVIVTSFVLYTVWYFVDQNESWHIPFFILSGLIVGVVATQRILVDAHSDIGLLLGLVVSLVSIILSRPGYFRGKFNF